MCKRHLTMRAGSINEASPEASPIDIFISEKEITSYAQQKILQPGIDTSIDVFCLLRFGDLLDQAAWRRLIVDIELDENAERWIYWTYEHIVLHCSNLAKSLDKKLEPEEAVFLEDYPIQVANVYRSENGKQLWLSHHLLRPLLVAYDMPHPYDEVKKREDPEELAGSILTEPPPFVLLPLRELCALPDTLIVPGEAEPKPSGSVLLQDLFDRIRQTSNAMDAVQRVFTEDFPHLYPLLAPMTLHNCGTRWLFTYETKASGQVEFYGLSCFPDLPPVHGILVGSDEELEFETQELLQDIATLGKAEWQNTRSNETLLDLINEGFTRPLNRANETSGDDPKLTWKLPPIELYSPFWSNAFIQGNACSWGELVDRSRLSRTRDLS
jgi:hypothetical protein